jgi:alpha-beta hydrolase superfamily lysophospholipase
MGKETPFHENDLTSDPQRYSRIISLIRKHPNIRLWGVTNGFAKAVNKRFKKIRSRGWAESIDLEILIINNLNDRVVDSNKIKEMQRRLKNSQSIEFSETEHEIFMEKTIFRKKMWEAIDNFL